MIPIGGGMHFTYLREIVQGIFASDCLSTEICLSINMEEDIAGGAIRISHLLVENRLYFDKKMENHGVYNYLPNSVFTKSKIRKCYWITCSDDYLAACDNNQWTCYKTKTPQEIENCKKSKKN